MLPVEHLKGPNSSPSAKHAREIMVALNLDAYKGKPQVKRQVFSGDEQPRPPKMGTRQSLDLTVGGDAEAPPAGSLDEQPETPGTSPPTWRGGDEEAE